MHMSLIPVKQVTAARVADAINTSTATQSGPAVSARPITTTSTTELLDSQACALSVRVGIRQKNKRRDKQDIPIA